MKCFKNQLIAAVLCFFVLPATAQVRPPFTNNDLRNNLQEVVANFSSHFREILGDTIEINPQSIEFSSRLDFKMATKNWITQYKSKNPYFSWEAEMLLTEDFEEAANKYKWLCNQLKVMTLTMKDGYSFTLSGDFEKPSEEKEFSSTIFKLTPNAASMPKLKIEAAMNFIFPGEWTVSLLVYEREREDRERGERNGD